MPDASQNVKLQNLRDFTVQIRRPSDNAIVGTGVAVSMEGEIITCAHVVRAAGIEPRQHKDAEIIVYFPQLSGGQKKERRARVKTWFPEHDDDIVLLQLTDSSMPLGPEQIAVLGSAEGSEGNPFRSYGYAPIGNRLSRYVDGEIMGQVEIVLPPETVIQADPVELRTRDIRPGISGGAVLDEKRNLVVGLVTEWWNAKDSPRDDNLGWATDATVVAFHPFNLPLATELPRRFSILLPSPPDSPTPLHPKEPFSPGGAPAVLTEWIGRDDLLNAITSDYLDPNKTITGLIGFGGEGKSSLARKWIDDLQKNNLASDVPPPDIPSGVFWWSFYDHPVVDEFFDAVLVWITGGQINARTLPSSSGKIHFIAGLFSTARYIFVLDGLEVLQHQGGDSYGLLKSSDLRQFIEYIGASGHQSFCLVTSRAPLLDLLSYATYTHRDITRLTPSEGTKLLLEVGVRGNRDQLIKVVSDWEGHALTLSLIGSYLAGFHRGDVAKISEFGADLPSDSERLLQNYEFFEKRNHVHRVLKRYDKHLTEPERTFLTIFSAFRLPIKIDAFETILREDNVALSLSLTNLDRANLGRLLKQLINYRLIREDEQSNIFTMHPIVREFYYSNYLKLDTSTSQIHTRIMEYYKGLAGNIGRFPAPNDLVTWIEIVHHACQAKEYDMAFNVFWKRLHQNNRKVLFHQLGIYEIALSFMLEFFPNGNIYEELNLRKLSDQCRFWIELGLCFLGLGRFTESIYCYNKGKEIARKIGNWGMSSEAGGNLSEIHLYLGELQTSKELARQAIEDSKKTNRRWLERNAQTYYARVCYLTGNMDEASKHFRFAQEVQNEIYPELNYLYSMGGMIHTDYLLRKKELTLAHQLSQLNLQFCESNHLRNDIGLCYRFLAEAEAQLGNYDVAVSNFQKSLSIAHTSSKLQIPIEALYARGNFLAKHSRNNLKSVSSINQLTQAFADLNEALSYATQNGYRLHEADIRIALAWAYKASGDPARARLEATHARQMSEEMGYYWGKVDADEVLQALETQA